MPRRAAARKTAATVRLCLALSVVASAGVRVAPFGTSESNKTWPVQMQNNRHRRGFAEEGVAEYASHASARTLATVRLSRSISLRADLAVNVSSIIPVFSKSESFIAFVFDIRSLPSVDFGLYCASEDGKHRSEVTVKHGMIWRCDWPVEERERPCHTVVLEKGVRGSHFESLGTFETCHNTTVYSNAAYRLAACVPNVWEDPDIRASGILHLAPWLEYGVMHGVDQFLFYDLPDTDPRVKEIMEPYFKQGLATQVVVDTDGMPYASRGYSAQRLLGQDCLYRMMHRAEWLMPYIDTDEYIHFNATDRTSFPAIMSEIAAREESKQGLRANGLSFERIGFAATKAPLQELLVSAALRKSLSKNFSCPKYVVKPHLVHSLDIHRPLSWVPQTFTVNMPPASMAAYHYRNEFRLRTPDTSMRPEVPLLEEAIFRRFGLSWSELSAYLEASRPFSLLASSTLQGWDREERCGKHTRLVHLIDNAD